VSAPLVLDRFRITWSVKRVRPGDEDRRAGLVEALIDHGLEEAFERSGIRAGEEVCVRSVSAPPQTFDPGSDDETFVRRWAAAVAEAVVAAVASGSPGDDDRVVRYRSRHAALGELVCRAAVGDERREWAWRQLGLWPDGLSPAEAVALALARSPHSIVGALEIAARSGALPSVFGLLGPDRLRTLVTAAWVAGEGEPAFVAMLDDRGGVPPSPADRARAGALLGATQLGSRLRAATAATPVGSATEPAMLAVLAAEPAIAARARFDPAAVALVRAVRDELAGGRAAARWSKGDAAGDGGVRTSDRVDERSESPASPGVAHPQPDRPSGDPLDAVDAGDDPSAPDGSAAPGRTAFGGLLFLLHLVDALDPVATSAADPVLAGVPLPRLLHRLGTAILARATAAAPAEAPPDPRDPAVLAFCGLPPSAEPPGFEPPDPTWEDRVEAWAERILALLRTALEPSVLASAPGDELLVAVCRRRAEVVADPGWIDVRLELDEVSTDVRRAGLDLDLGYLSWLGCVVRFVYG